MMKIRPINHLVIILTSFLFSIFISCSTVPITGRQQLNLIADSTMLSMSVKQYTQFLASHKRSNDVKRVRLIRKVGKKIQQAVEAYLINESLSDELKNYDWEFNLIDSKEANAWCMPGGKVVVYTGLLTITQDEDSLAVVMAHEIAHAVARHGNERMSQALLSSLGQATLSKSLKNKPEKVNNLWLNIYGIGTRFGILLPYSRLQESEADRLGLIFMAMAGYDPRNAVAFWERMAKQKKKQPGIELLSTHPSDGRRIDDIQELLPEAMFYYNPQH